MEERIEFTEQEKAQGYRVGRWVSNVDNQVFNNYLCGRCSFEILFKPMMDAHIKENKHIFGQPPGGPYIVDAPVVVVDQSPTEAEY